MVWFAVLEVLATPASAQCTLAEDAGGVVINELLPNPDGVDAGKEWLEVFNGGTQPVTFDGWLVASGTSAYSVSEALADFTLPPGERVVLGQAVLPEVDFVLVGLDLPNASSNADAVQLRDCKGTAVDTVVYGSPNKPDRWLDDGQKIATSLAPVPGSGESLGRVPDGVDTDASAADFVVLALPTPSESNDPVVGECGGAASGVKINEFMSDPEGADAGREWVELFHGGEDPVDLDGWALQAGTMSFDTAVVFASIILAPGDHLVVGGVDVPQADVVDGFSLGNASGSSDGIRLVDCAAEVVDTVVYGSPNDGEPPFVDDSGEVAVSLAASPGEAAALQRLADGYDTDASAVDFAVTLVPTPGEPNDVIEPVVCVPDGGSVTINEILPDPDGEDAGAEFVELFNAADAAVSVAGWSLSAGTQGFDVMDVVLPSGTTIPPSGFLVVGGDRVAQVDVIRPFSLGNGTGTDGARLFDCEGTAVDTVVYGEAPNEDGIPDDLGAVGPPYGDPTNDESLARVEDGVDTDAPADWVVKARATPGATNVSELIPSNGALQPSGCGARSEARDVRTPRDVESPEPPQPACGVVPGGWPGSLPVLWALLLVWPRRRRW